MARSRSSLGIFTPLMLILVAGLTWGAAWFFLANVAEDRIADTLKQASARGWTLSCGDQALGGFPFRIEFDCNAPQLAIETARSRVTVKSQQLKLVALVYNLDQGIAEVAGPTTIETFQLGGVRRTYSLRTDSARASVEFIEGDAIAVSAVLSKVNAEIPTLDLLNDGSTSTYVADRAAFHLRQAIAKTDVLDLALTLDNSRLAGELSGIFFEVPELTAKTVDFLGQMTKKNVLRSGSFTDNAVLWQAAGGEMQIQRFKIEAPALDVEVSGVGRLDNSGKAEGKFKGVFGKLKQLIKDLKSRGVLNDDGARLAAGAVGLLARPVKGSARVELPVSVTAGEVFLGPLRTMVLPPVF